jgi:hypothetical protein
VARGATSCSVATAVDPAGTPDESLSFNALVVGVP